MQLSHPDLQALSPPALRLRMGFDLVQISQVADSVRAFGPVYMARVFTPGEIEYAHQGTAMVEQRLAARFAAKEALIKALGLSEAGIGWRDIEVAKLPSGECKLVLHGRAAELADKQGVASLLLSLSHDGDYAGAVVTALFHDTTS